MCVLSQTPPALQPQPPLARSANAAFAEAVQASLAQMLAELAAAGVFERPTQVFQHRRGWVSRMSSCAVPQSLCRASSSLPTPSWLQRACLS